MKKIIAILMTVVLGLGFSVAAFAEDMEAGEPLLIQNVEMVEENDEVLIQELDEDILVENEIEDEEELAEEEEEEEEEGESFWNQSTIIAFLVAMVAIIVILNLMQVR